MKEFEIKLNEGTIKVNCKTKRKYSDTISRFYFGIKFVELGKCFIGNIYLKSDCDFESEMREMLDTYSVEDFKKKFSKKNKENKRIKIKENAGWSITKVYHDWEHKGTEIMTYTKVCFKYQFENGGTFKYTRGIKCGVYFYDEEKVKNAAKEIIFNVLDEIDEPTNTSKEELHRVGCDIDSFFEKDTNGWFIANK